jgi:hypothetical protein
MQARDGSGEQDRFAEQRRDQGPRRHRDRVGDEEAAAAAEAGSIGGRAEEESVDPAERPVREAGGGEAEGFEKAEEELIEQAEHGAGRDPSDDAFPAEPEWDRDQSAHGKADEPRGNP